MRILPLTIAVSLAFATATKADWEYTKWDMSPDEVIAASQGQMRLCAPGACADQDTQYDRALLFGSYESGEFKFKAFANFDKANKLKLVSLNLIDDSKAYNLLQSLRAQYGLSIRVEAPNSFTRFYDWETKTDLITLAVVGPLITLSYELLGQSNQSKSSKKSKKR